MEEAELHIEALWGGMLSPEMICYGLKTFSPNPTKQQLTGQKWSLALPKEQIPSGTIGLCWWGTL